KPKVWKNTSPACRIFALTLNARGYLSFVFLILLKLTHMVLNPHKIHTLQNDDTPLLAAGFVIDGLSDYPI
ncbi:MAG: hypothetical protein LBH20_10690, partial [Treponema sp.]|nr:hypothetical protein [Treponema sp.]